MARKRIAGCAMGVLMFSLVAACRTHAQQVVDKGDPNLPGMNSPPGGVSTPSGVTIQWVNMDPTHPSVIFAAPGGVHTSHAAQYLGWNDQGSYLRNYDDHQVYVWNLSKGTLTKIGIEIPPETIASLKNNPYAVAKNAAPPPPKAQGPEPQTPSTSRQAAFFGDTGKIPAPSAPSGAIAGTGAAIQGGVLTFTRADKTRASYKVVRPKVMQNNPQSGGITGTWITMEEEGKGIIFTVQADGTLTGREMPAQVIQMLTQGAAQH